MILLCLSRLFTNILTQCGDDGWTPRCTIFVMNFPVITLQVFIVGKTSQQIGQSIWYYWHRGAWHWIPRLFLVPWISSLLAFCFWRVASCNRPVGRKIIELSVYTWCHWCRRKISQTLMILELYEILLKLGLWANTGSSKDISSLLAMIANFAVQSFTHTFVQNVILFTSNNTKKNPSYSPVRTPYLPIIASNELPKTCLILERCKAHYMLWQVFLTIKEDNSRSRRISNWSISLETFWTNR